MYTFPSFSFSGWVGVNASNDDDTPTTHDDAPTTEKFDSAPHLEITFGGRTDARTHDERREW